MNPKRRKQPPTPNKSPFRMSALVVSAVVGSACVLIGVSLLLRESEPETPLTISATSTPIQDSILSLYREKYARIVESVNALDHQSALDALSETPVDTNDDLFIRGILLSWLGEDQKAAALLTDAAIRAPKPPSSRMLFRHAAKWRLDPIAIDDLRFNPDDSRYIRRCHFLKRIADRVTSESPTELEKVRELLDWVFRHIAFFEPKVFDVSALDVLLRGYGVCDRSAWVLALLCEQVGLPATLVLLGTPTVSRRDRAEFRSDHTLCQVLVSGRWLLCDTLQGAFVTFPDNDKPVTLKEIFLRLENEPKNDSFQKRFKGYRRAGVAVACEADGAFPRLRLLNPYLRALPPHPVVFVDLDASLQQAYSSSPQVNGQRVNQTGIWDYPFYSRASYKDQKFLAQRQEDLAPMLSYQNARILQLLGHPLQAIQTYLRVGETASPQAKENILYFMAQCYYEAAQFRNAETSFTIYLKEYPRGRWNTETIYHLARTKEKLGDLTGALKLYRDIRQIEVARKRALSLESR